MSLEDIETLLARLQTPMIPNRLFADYLQEAWKLFQLPGNPSLPKFEAFLINVVLNEFKEADCNEDEAKNRDTCLVGLGLLEGCYHTEIRNGVPTHRKLSERRISYLSGDYVKLQYPNAQADKNLNIADRKSAPRRAVEKSEKRSLERLAAKLASMQSGVNGSYQECLRIGVKKYIKSVVVSDEKGEREIRKIILPQPCYTIENFGPQDEKNPITTPETASAIAEPVELDLEPSTEQIQAPTPDPPSEPSMSVHDLTPKLTSESPMEPTLKSAPEPLSESDRKQRVDTTLEPTQVSPLEPAPDFAEALTQELPPEPAQEPSIDTASKSAYCDESKPGRAAGLINRLRQSIRKAVPRLILGLFLIVVIVALVVKIHLSIFLPSAITDYPPENGGGILVEKLTCSSESVRVYPGNATTLPIRVIPSEADGVFLYCTSLNEDILYGHDGTEAKVEVIGYYELGDPPVEARVMVIPQNRATSNVYIEIPVIIDYTRTMQEPH